MNKIFKYIFCLLLWFQIPTTHSAPDLAIIKASALGFTAGLFTNKFWPTIASLKNLWSYTSPKPSSVNIGLIAIDLDKHSAWDCLFPFEELFIDKEVQAVIMRLEGKGSYATSEALGLIIKHLKTKYAKPIIVYSDNSYLIGAQYLLSCAADSIFVSPATEVGGLDVVWNIKRVHEKNQEEGREYHFIHRGKFKGFDTPEIPHTTEFQEAAEECCAHLYNYIVSTTATLRPVLPRNTDLWAGGKTLNANAALNLQLVDKICSKAEVFQEIFMRLDIPFDARKITSRIINPSPLSSHTRRGSGLAHKTRIGILKINNLSKKSSWDYVKSMHSLFSDDNIHGIVLAIDEDGSAVNIAVSLHQDLLYFKSYYKKPLVAYIEYRALSGAYLIASAADKIVATPSAEVGCFGVWAGIFDDTKKNAKEHIEYVTIKAGKDPAIFSYDIPFNTQRREILQKRIDTVYALTGEILKRARPCLAHNEALWCEAQRLMGVNALKIGLIDKLGSPFDAFNCVKQLLNPDAQEENIDLENSDLIIKNID